MYDIINKMPILVKQYTEEQSKSATKTASPLA